MHKSRLLFLIILIEGYVVLACELLAIRQLIPFTGSGTEVVCILISAVLLPLAAGYYAGGHARPSPSVRKVLFKNILISLIILTPGLSYLFLDFFFQQLHMIGITDRLLKTTIYASIFLAIPVFLLGQTVPLISHYWSKEKLRKITGKMLFFSTAGSFLGSVFSTLILMNCIGVHNTAIVTLGLLSVMGLLLSRKIWNYAVCLSVLIAGIIINNNFIMQSRNIVSDNAYSIVRIVDVPQEEITILGINRSPASVISKDPEKRAEYVKYIEKTFINTAVSEGEKPQDILIIGAGGFTMGLGDTLNHYTFIDIDKDIKGVAEKYFLKETLSPNKQFIAASARAYVHNSDKKYDLIILDTYTNVFSIPMECITREFLQDVKALLKQDGVVVANIISTPNFRDKFTVRYDNTFSSVFPVHTRQVINRFSSNDSAAAVANVLYIYYHNALTDDKTIYTDDKNSYSSDRQ